MTEKKSKTGMVLWTISTVIAVFISFVLFLGGISGSGNYDLINAAYWVWAIPSIIWGAIGFTKTIFNTDEDEPSDPNK